MNNTIFKLSVSTLALAACLCSAQPAKAGLLSSITGGGAASAGASSTPGGAGAGAGAGFSNGAAGAGAGAGAMAGNGSLASAIGAGAAKQGGGAFAGATAETDASGRTKAVDLYGDNMVKVKLRNEAETASLHGGARRAAISESDANAAMAEAVSLEGVPQARNSRVNEDGSITLGAASNDEGTHASARGNVSASAETPDVRKDAREAKKDAEKVARKLPVKAHNDEDGTRVTANVPGGKTKVQKTND
jgi:hypothetical protein